jgi:hypothetical protein
MSYGNGYQPTAVKDVALMYRAVKAYEPDFHTRAFVDVGAGKGKVLVKWRSLLAKDGLQQIVTGVEIDPVLHAKSADRGPVFLADAAGFDYHMISDRLILWVFNPFGVEQFAELMQAVAGIDCLIVANNPAHVEVCINLGMAVTHVEWRGDQRNSWFLIDSKGIPSE